MSNNIQSLIDSLNNLRKFLDEDGDSNWIRGIDRILEVLKSKPSSDSSVQNAYEIYSSMRIGKESFNDYFAWDDDPIVRKKKNEILKQMKRDVIKRFSDVL